MLLCRPSTWVTNPIWFEGSLPFVLSTFCRAGTFRCWWGRSVCVDIHVESRSEFCRRTKTFRVWPASALFFHGGSGRSPPQGTPVLVEDCWRATSGTCCLHGGSKMFCRPSWLICQRRQRSWSMTGRKKIRLWLGLNETSDTWHAQQKFAISCFGCSSFQWQTVSGRSQVQRLGQDFILHVLWFAQYWSLSLNYVLHFFVLKTSSSADLPHLSDRSARTNCRSLQPHDCCHSHQVASTTTRGAASCVERLRATFSELWEHGASSNFVYTKVRTSSTFGTVSRFIQEAALKRPFCDIQHLLVAVAARNAKRHDPRSPKWNVQLVDLGGTGHCSSNGYSLPISKWPEPTVRVGSFPRNATTPPPTPA